MPKYLTITGEPTTADDPKRQVFIAANCGFWTDDWSLTGKVGPGIPCCPTCKSPGFQDGFARWLGAAERFQATDHPRYAEWVLATRGKCTGRTSPALQMKRYQDWLRVSVQNGITEDERHQITESRLAFARLSLKDAQAMPLLVVGLNWSKPGPPSAAVTLLDDSMTHEHIARTLEGIAQQLRQGNTQNREI